MGQSPPIKFPATSFTGNNGVTNPQDVLNKTAQHSNSYGYVQRGTQGTSNANVTYTSAALNYNDFPANSVNRKISKITVYVDGGLYRGGGTSIFSTGHSSNVHATPAGSPRTSIFSQSQSGTGSGVWGSMFGLAVNSLPNVGATTSVLVELSANQSGLSTNTYGRSCVSTVYFEATFAWEDPPPDLGESRHFVDGNRINPGNLYIDGRQVLKRYVNNNGVYRLSGTQW